MHNDCFTGRRGFATTPMLLAIGGGMLEEAGNVARKLRLQRPLIVTDSFMMSCGIGARLVSILTSAGFSPHVFADVLPDPSTQTVAAALEGLRDGDCDSVIALGGGSPLDAGKAVAVLATNGGAMRDYMGYHRVAKPPLPLLAIPTTAGTGSEVTKVTVITDSANNEKMMCLDQAFLPLASIVDFELTMGMPYRLTADTGIDSLTHAIEAYVSRKAHPYTDSIALVAMTAIARYLPVACREPGNREAREAMMLGAMQAGMAFSNSSVCLVHGMSRPIGALFHVPHGLSNAMLLPAVTRYSVSGATGRYADCARAVGAATGADSDSIAGDKLIGWLEGLNELLQVPSPAEWGIDQAVWEKAKATMAQQALASGSPANNPRVPGAQEIITLYDEVYR